MNDLFSYEETPYVYIKRTSGGRCQAMMTIGSAWFRCYRSPVEVHHMLPRSRGGLILDAAGETAHLIALCNEHHRHAHGPTGHEDGLMFDGYVTTSEQGQPIYAGSDPRLRHLKEVDVFELPGDVRGPEPGEGLRVAP